MTKLTKLQNTVYSLELEKVRNERLQKHIDRLECQLEDERNANDALEKKMYDIRRIVL